ncbi:Carbonic anhydrase 2 [compost metagenome]
MYLEYENLFKVKCCLNWQKRIFKLCVHTPTLLFPTLNAGRMIFSVIQYAVDVLKVKHILVTGHYGCGGVRASMQDRQFGLIDGWLRSIRDLYYEKREELAKLATEEEQVDRLCELNVIQQVANVGHTSIVQNAWHRGQNLSIHGCIYGIKDGRWKSLDATISGFEQLPPQYRLRPFEPL